MGSQLTVLILRLIHITGGVFLGGAVITLARFILPSAAALGPAGGDVMREIAQVRKLPIAINVAALFTILSGIGLYWRMESLSNHAFSHSAPGITFGLGGLIALFAAIVGNVVSRPTGQRMVTLGAQISAQGTPPTPAQQAELGQLREKLRKATSAIAVMLVLTTMLMAVARYV